MIASAWPIDLNLFAQLPDSVNRVNDQSEINYTMVDCANDTMITLTLQFVRSIFFKYILVQFEKETLSSVCVRVYVWWYWIMMNVPSSLILLFQSTHSYVRVSLNAHFNNRSFNFCYLVNNVQRAHWLESILPLTSAQSSFVFFGFLSIF